MKIDGHRHILVPKAVELASKLDPGEIHPYLSHGVEPEIPGNKP